MTEEARVSDLLNSVQMNTEPPTEAIMEALQTTTRHGLHWTLDKGIRVALQALVMKASETYDGFAAGRQPGNPGFPDRMLFAEDIIDNLRAVESMASSLASDMETTLRMNRWREHLGDDPLNGFGGRGPAEYHYMATHEPEGPGLTRFGEGWEDSPFGAVEADYDQP